MIRMLLYHFPKYHTVHRPLVHQNSSTFFARPHSQRENIQFSIFNFQRSERSVPHTARCSQCGQRRRQCGYRYANHHFPKTFLFHSFYFLIELRSSLLSLGIIGTSSILLSLNRSLNNLVCFSLFWLFSFSFLSLSVTARSPH